ncbi:hypothetical protein ABT160_36560 [Streptomyces sp. NPDC001941]|uniref:ATP-grasp domain-containing protein n=1 Tax=Streptomyces sp. NPDC001941 TaxID=3154659 RepID=UPI00332BF3B6
MHTTGAGAPVRRNGDILILNGGALDTEVGARLFLRGVDTVFRSVGQLGVSVTHGTARAFETEGGRDLATYGMVQVASYPRPTATLMSAVNACLEATGAPTVASASIAAPTKLYQCVRLVLAGLPVPETHYLPTPFLRHHHDRLVRRLGSPFVLKAMTGSCGRHNFLVGDEESFRAVVDDPAHSGLLFLAQRFVPNNGTFRLLVFGDEVSVVMHRCNTDGGHLTNTARGAHATLFDTGTFDDGVKRIAVRAARLMGCDVAGVNVVQHRGDGSWHVLEVTPSPALGTGAFVDAKLDAYTAYLERTLGAASEPVGTR